MAEMDGNGGAGTAVSSKASDDEAMEERKDGGTVAGSATFVVRGLGKSFSQPFLGGNETAIMVEHMQKHHKKEWTEVHTAQQKQQTMTLTTGDMAERASN